MDTISETLNSPEEESQAARELRSQRTQARRDGQFSGPGSASQSDRPMGNIFGQGNSLQRAARKAGLDRVRSQEDQGNSESIQHAALQAYRRGWSLAHEFLENLTLAWFGTVSLILGPPTILFFLFRVAVGNFGLFGHFGTFEAPGVSIPRVPPMDVFELPYRTGKTIFVALVTGIFWGSILMVWFFATRPDMLLKVFGARTAAGYIWTMIQSIGLSPTAQIMTGQ